jgi:peptidoglycan/LPS O-acetylase OafA/YrhL
MRFIAPRRGPVRAAAEPAPGADGYVPAIDGLRAVAILAVVAYHLRPSRLPGGFAGVDLFFVISGFVVAASLARRRFTGLRELVSYFYARRIVRILPALLVMLLVTSVLSTLLVRFYGLALGRSLALPAFFGVSNVAMALSGEAYFATRADLNPFLHTWTLGVEEQFYLVFPFFFYLFRRSWGDGAENRVGLRFVAAACALSLALCALLARTNVHYAFYLMPSRLWELGAGVALWVAIHRWQPLLARMRAPAAALASAALIGALAACFLYAPARGSPLPWTLVPVGAGAGLIAMVCARPASLLAGTLSHPAPVFVGRLSYSLYLWHWPVFALFRWTIGLHGARHALAALALSAAAASASYFLVEQPFRRSRRVAALRRRSILAWGGGSALAGALAATGIFEARELLPAPTAHSAYWVGEPPRHPCSPSQAKEGFHGGFRESWVPKCAVPGVRGTLWVIGDSHVPTFQRMLSRYAAAAPRRVTLLYKFGCAVPSVAQPSAQAPHCAGFRKAVLAAAGEMKEGDVIFLPALRVPHLNEFWTGARLLQAGIPPGERETAYREAAETLRALSARGAHVVLEAPPPIFRASPFRCSDWFNRRNPACRDGFEVGRNELLRHRAPVAGAMERLAATIPGVSVWDPFPVLCPGSVCSALRDGRPLYFDTNHMGALANDLLLPSFRRTIESLAGPRPVSKKHPRPPTRAHHR